MSSFRQAGIDSAAAENKRIAQQRDLYQSTTAPLNQINDTLKDIKQMLDVILEVLKKRL